MSTTTTKANMVARTYRKRLGKQEERIVQVAEGFTPAVSADWSTVPTTQDGALDTLAAQNSGAAMRTVKETWDFSVHGGAISTIGLGTSIPDDAVVLYVTQDVLVAPDSAGDNGTIKLVLPTDGDLTANVTADGTGTGPVDGIPVWTAATAVKTTAARQLSVTIGTSAITVGKINYFVTYAISD